LRACYFNSLSEASKLGATSIAFCTIATGIYGYPIEQAAKLAIETAIIYAREHKESSLRRVAFALYGEHEFDVFQRAYSVEAGESN
jgi:O-acetyl-ADP-ribose deacetylase (regulator of RNase III)